MTCENEQKFIDHVTEYGQVPVRALNDLNYPVNDLKKPVTLNVDSIVTKLQENFSTMQQTPQTSKNFDVGNEIKNLGAKFLGSVISAKQQGQNLPSSLDAIASTALAGKKEAVSMAENEVRSRVVKYVGYAIAVILLIVIILKK
jgi:hypothetical protein